MGLHERLAEASAWGWPLIANHLWQATILSVFAAGAARLLKGGPARARYMIWLIASLKFAVPSALIVLLATQAGIELPSVFDSASGATVAYQVAEPVARITQSPDSTAGTARGHNEIYCALTAIWMAGTGLMLALWASRRRRFSLLIRTGEAARKGREAEAVDRVRAWLALKRQVKLVIIPELVEPGVWRAWNPVIVLPARIAEELTDAELDAVMMHEMIHVARWDNLTNTMQMLLCCLLWFHPVVWLIDRKLLAEREQACDEQVVELGGSSKVYASSLLKVFRFCMGSKMAGVSYITGSNLRRRVEQIMAENTGRRFAMSHRIMVAAIAVMVIGLSLATGLFAAAQSKKGNIIEPGGPNGGVPGGITGGVSGGVSGGISGGVSGGVSGGISGGIAGGVSGIAQDQSSAPPPPPPMELSDDVIEQIEKAPEITAQFVNRDNTPLAITDVKVKGAQRIDIASGDSASRKYYAAKMLISVVNNTDAAIESVKFRFTNKDTNYILITDRIKLRIKPHATYRFGESARDIMIYLTQLGAPESLAAEVIGVRFKDGSVWGDATRPPAPPAPPPPPPPAQSADSPAPALPGTPAEPSAPAAPSEDAAPDGSKIVRKPGGVLQSAAIKRVQPTYPLTAKAAQVSGAVVVEIIISEEGRVISARAISGHPLLMASAVEAARQWEFEPIIVSGAAVRVIGTLTFNFQL